MMKLVSRGVLVAAIASLALAGSTTMSFAAKKKAAAKSASCVPATWCGSNCKSGVCQANWCGADGKRYAGAWCWEPFCGPKC